MIAETTSNNIIKFTEEDKALLEKIAKVADEHGESAAQDLMEILCFGSPLMLLPQGVKREDIVSTTIGH